MSKISPPEALQAEQQAMLSMLRQILEPMVQLCLVKGVSIQAMDEVMRQVFVQVATRECASPNPSRLTSRISTMTGLTRREVARIQGSQAPARPVTRSVSNDVLTQWVSQPDYVNRRGLPIAIPRTGQAPSFEALAASVTTDVHPKSVLAEMQRLNLVEHRSDSDTVALVRSIFVPDSNWPQMMAFLGANVGDHLSAAVANVLGGGHQHFEQSLLADELSQASLEQAKSLITAQWRALMTQIGPQLQSLMEQDRVAGRVCDQQLRIGLYSYMTGMPHMQQMPQKLSLDGEHDEHTN